jgi:hypothetical protein
VRKLWTARVLVLLSAAALGAVVVEEHQQQERERESEQLQRISGPAAPARPIDLQVGGAGLPPVFSTTPYLPWSAEERARPASRLREPGR